MSNDLLRLVYHSHHGGLSDAAMRPLAEEAARISREFGITGFVTSGYEDFLVMMEGTPLIIVKGITDIVHDPRHTDVKVLSVEVASTRLCTTWKVIDASGPRAIDGLEADFDPAMLEPDRLREIVAKLARLP